MGDGAAIRARWSRGVGRPAPAADDAQGLQIVSVLGAVPWWEQAFAVLALLLSTWAIVPLLRLTSRQYDPGAYATEGDPLAQAIWSGVYALGLAIFATRCWRSVPQILGSDVLLWLLQALVAVSIAWSASPDVSAKRAVALFGTSLLGIYFASRYTRGDVLRLLGWALAIAVLLSIAVVLVSPEYGVDASNPEVGWRGVFSQKNILGRIMALSVVVWLLVATDYRRYRIFALALVLLSLSLVVLSASKTAWVVCVSLMVLLGIAAFGRARHSQLPVLVAGVLIGLGALLVGLVGDFGDLVDVLGRDVTLTGRTQLWQLVWQQIQDRPWFGYGFGGFWLGWEGPSVQVWTSARYWLPPDGHNGFLDTWLDVGAVGLVLLLGSLAINLRRAVALLRTTGRSYELTFPLLFVGFFVLSNVTESVAVRYDALLWMLYVTTALQLGGTSPHPIGLVESGESRPPLARRSFPHP